MAEQMEKFSTVDSFEERVLGIGKAATLWRKMVDGCEFPEDLMEAIAMSDGLGEEFDEAARVMGEACGHVIQEPSQARISGMIYGIWLSAEAARQIYYVLTKDAEQSDEEE